jgi:hypothetical protein
LATALALSVLTLSITACASEPRIVYVHDAAVIPSFLFPIFPSPDNVRYDEAADTVLMPLEYWQKIAEYKIGVDAIEEYINKLRERTGTGKERER